MHNFIDILMPSKRLLHFIICKLYCSEIQQNAKVEITIHKGEELYYSSVATFKNGWANFYRQPFELNGQIQDFYLEITETNTRLIQASLYILSSLLNKIDFRNNCFETFGNGYRLEWEAKFTNDTDNRDYQATDRDQDFAQFNEVQDDANSCQINLQPAKHIMNKRKKSKKSSDLISEPSSLNQQSGQRTNDTFILKKRSQQIQIQENYFHSCQLDQKKQTRKKLLTQNNKKMQMIIPIQRQDLRQVRSCEKINKSKIVNNEERKFLSPECKRSKSPKLKRFLSGGLSSINFTGLISTAVVGILSGIAAAHV